MKKLITFTIILAIVVAAPALAQKGRGQCDGPCGGPMMGMGMHGGGMMGMHGGHMMGGQCNMLGCARELGLTEEQQAKIKDINFKHQQMMVDLKATLEKAQLNMRHGMKNDADRNQALSMAKEVQAAKAKIAAAKINHRFDLKDVLTREQLEKWQNCQADCGGRGCCGGSGMGMGKGMMGMGMGTAPGPDMPEDDDD